MRHKWIYPEITPADNDVNANIMVSTLICLPSVCERCGVYKRDSKEWGLMDEGYLDRTHVPSSIVDELNEYIERRVKEEEARIQAEIETLDECKDYGKEKRTS